jgi:hypothetical protein
MAIRRIHGFRHDIPDAGQVEKVGRGRGFSEGLKAINDKNKGHVTFIRWRIALGYKVAPFKRQIWGKRAWQRQ